MFHRKLERQKSGQPIVARTLNQIMDLVERVANLRVAAPLAMTDTASGPQIYFASGIGQLIPGNTGSGFASGGTPGSPKSATVTIYTSEGANGSWATTKSVTAYSIYDTAVPGSKTAWYWQSPSTGSYYIVTADC